MGLTPGKGGYGLDAVLSGKASPEVVVVADADFSAAADDPEKVALLRKARFLAVAARTSNALTRAADVVLPAASLAQKEGTFTNVAGARPAVRARLPPDAAVARHTGSCSSCSAVALGLRRPQLDARGPARRRSRAEVEAYDAHHAKRSSRAAAS